VVVLDQPDQFAAAPDCGAEFDGVLSSGDAPRALGYSRGTRDSSASASLAGSNAVERAATLMKFVAALHVPKHGPGTDDNTAATPPLATAAVPAKIAREIIGHAQHVHG
jgi:hypothetical protein